MHEDRHLMISESDFGDISGGIYRAIESLQTVRPRSGALRYIFRELSRAGDVFGELEPTHATSHHGHVESRPILCTAGRLRPVVEHIENAIKRIDAIDHPPDNVLDIYHDLKKLVTQLIHLIEGRKASGQQHKHKFHSGGSHHKK